MAELVLGVGTSHSPMLSLDGEEWLEWGERRDHESPLLFDADGVRRPYPEHLEQAPADMAERITRDKVVEACARAERALDVLRDRIAKAELDVLVIVGDDQDEHLLRSNLPPFLIYYGDTIRNADVESMGDLPPLLAKLWTGYKETAGARDYPVHADLARHLISSLMADGFDVASSNALPVQGRDMGHAFGFPMRRLAPPDVPLVPVIINTYTPPSQPTARRCADFGAAIRRAVDALGDGLRVGLVASGGLSHFVVMEDLDRRVLAAMERGDVEDLCAVPEPVLQSGTSEIKNWIAVAAACPDLRFEVLDYVPGYRTPAGTGTGLAFATWS